MRSSSWIAILLCIWSAVAPELGAQTIAAQKVSSTSISEAPLLDAAAIQALAEDVGQPLPVRYLPVKGVFERLMVLLEAIPMRWESIPAPIVHLTGRSSEEVLSSSSDVERWQAMQVFRRLVLTPYSNRKALIEEELRQNKLSELDLWFPGALMDSQQGESIDLAAVTLEGWLELAEVLGRRDILLFGASYGIDLVARKLGDAKARSAALPWLGLSQVPHSEVGRAAMTSSAADVLARLGEHERALEAYRQARKIFLTIDSKLGQATTWWGEAELLSRIGDNQRAIEAYEKSRSLYQAVDSHRGQANTWKGEADVLARVGNDDKALEAYGEARSILQKHGSSPSQGGWLAETWLGEASILSRRGKNKEALDAYRKARSLFEAVNNRIGQGNALRGEASTLLLLGENLQALEASRRACFFYAVSGDRFGLGHARRIEGDVLFRLGKTDEAIDSYGIAKQLFVDIKESLGEARCWLAEAAVFLFLGETKKALNSYRVARELFVRINDVLGQANSWVGESDVLNLMGENEKALTAIRKARQIFREAGSSLGEGNAWLNEGKAFFFTGDNQQALEAYRVARKLFCLTSDKLGQANTLRGEAAVLVHLGENARALGAYIEASRLFLEVGDPVGKANCEVDIATLLYNSGAYQQALALFRGARKSFQSLASPLGEANAWLGEADVDVEVGDIKSGMSAYREARKIYLKIEDNNGMGTSWLGESNAFRTNRDWPEVRKAAENAIAAYTKAVIIPGQESAYLLKAEAEIQLGDTKAAVNSASEAIHLHSQWRKTWITDRHRTAQEAAISKAYDFLVPLRARQETQTAEALRLAEEARARVLLDLLATPPNRGENVSASDLMAERQRLEAKIWQIEDKLRNTAALDQQEDLRSQRRQLDQELAWNSYQRIAGQKESLTEAPTLGADSIKALALETGPLLMYYAAEQEVWGFLILPRKGIVVRSVALSWLGLGREIRELTHDLANPILETDAEAQARKLWDLLIGPFSEEIPEGGPLVLVPHGPLHELPFEALLDPAGKPLFEHWQISVTPSASALDFARRRHASPSPSDSFLGFASGRGLNLPTAEVAEISGFFGTGQAAFHPTAANFKNYLERVAQARHLLIATRGVHVEGSRSETYLEIDPTPEVHDSRLSAAEIATIPLQAELVTLAACDTSYGHALLSDERLDLTRSFLIARAAAVLGTRWKVPEDAVTSRFLADFYRLYRHGGPQGKGLRKDEALTEARRRSRERGDPSQLWAAWVLVGDAR